jgi:hypothetical protein
MENKERLLSVSLLKESWETTSSVNRLHDGGVTRKKALY